VVLEVLVVKVVMVGVMLALIMVKVTALIVA
jgi:hypothetical protein